MLLPWLSHICYLPRRRDSRGLPRRRNNTGISNMDDPNYYFPRRGSRSRGVHLGDQNVLQDQFREQNILPSTRQLSYHQMLLMMLGGRTSSGVWRGHSP